MHPLKAVKSSFTFRLSLKILLLIAGVIIVSGVFYYLLVERISLAPSYGKVIANISVYKAEIFRKSIYIYTGFTALILAGVALLTIMYSHRVAGPLERIKAVSREIAKGRFDITVKLRKNDVIHPLSDSVNLMAQKYKHRDERLKDSAAKMAENLHALDAAIKSGNRELVDKAVASLSASSSEIEGVLSNIKL